MTARLGSSLQAVLEMAGVRWKRDPAPDAAVVHCDDMEAYARHFNEGFAEARSQFAELLTEAREDLADDATAAELLGCLDDAVKAMGGSR